MVAEVGLTVLTLGEYQAVRAGQRAMSSRAAIPDDSEPLIGETKTVATGSYTIYFESGRTYSGKGPITRARTSAKEKELAHGDTVVEIEFMPATSHRQAFKDEHLRIIENGGPKANSNYNVINSPGKKYWIQDGQ